MRTRVTSESASVVYAEQETDELLAMLRETERLDEQGDILQYLVDTHGLDFNTGTTHHYNNTRSTCMHAREEQMVPYSRATFK